MSSARLVTFLGIERYSLWDQSFLIPSFSRTDVHLAITTITTTVRLIEKGGRLILERQIV